MRQSRDDKSPSRPGVVADRGRPAERWRPAGSSWLFLAIADRYDLCAPAHPSARNAHILQSSKDELKEMTMTTAKLIAANFAAWSLAVGIWAMNLGMFEAVA